jgi:hypothetical protein
VVEILFAPEPFREINLNRRHISFSFPASGYHNHRRRRPPGEKCRALSCACVGSTKWPTVCSIPCPPNDDDQDSYQDHQQVVKVELKRHVKPLKVDELINYNHPLFIGKFLGSEARYERDEVDNRVRYIEKHLEPPLIPSNFQYTGAAARLIL